MVIQSQRCFHTACALPAGDRRDSGVVERYIFLFYTEFHHLNCKYQLMFYTPSFYEAKFIRYDVKQSQVVFLKRKSSVIFIFIRICEPVFNKSYSE